MNEESGELPVNKDPALLRQMLKKVSGKNHKLKEELAILQETIQSHENSLLLKEETINKSNEKTQELENTIIERELVMILTLLLGIHSFYIIYIDIILN